MVYHAYPDVEKEHPIMAKRMAEVEVQGGLVRGTVNQWKDPRPVEDLAENHMTDLQCANVQFNFFLKEARKRLGRARTAQEIATVINEAKALESDLKNRFKGTIHTEWNLRKALAVPISFAEENVRHYVVVDKVAKPTPYCMKKGAIQVLAIGPDEFRNFMSLGFHADHVLTQKEAS